MVTTEIQKMQDSHKSYPYVRDKKVMKRRWMDNLPINVLINSMKALHVSGQCDGVNERPAELLYNWRDFRQRESNLGPLYQ